MRVRTWAFVAAGCLIALVLAGVVSHWASDSPDGLNKVAADKGFDDTATEHHASDGPLAGYTTDIFDDPWLAGAAAGAAGVVVCFGIAGAFVLLVRRRKPDASAAPGPDGSSG